MKAFVHRKYGPPDVLQLQDVDMPTLEDDDVLVRVRAASANPLDWRVMEGTPIRAEGLFRPKIGRRGVDLAGLVEKVGRNVTEFKAGDEVFGACEGAFAEYVCGKERHFAPKPVGLSFEQASAIGIAGFTALQALRDGGRLQPGQKVLINGAAGGVGTFAVQIAKAFGAEVTGVCCTGNVELVRSLGADDVVDYTQQDFTKGPRQFDLLLDNVGNRSPFASRRRVVPEGNVVLVGVPHSTLAVVSFLLKSLAASRLGKPKVTFFMAKNSKDDMLALKELIEAGRVMPVIDRTYPFEEAPEALRYLEKGHARGKVVITVASA